MWKYVQKHGLPGLIISGGARGADTLADKWSALHGINMEVYPAEWERYGKAAGPIRNQLMLDRLLQEEIPRLLAFLAKGSKGTKNMIDIASNQDINITIIGV